MTMETMPMGPDVLGSSAFLPHRLHNLTEFFAVLRWGLNFGSWLSLPFLNGPFNLSLPLQDSLDL